MTRDFPRACTHPRPCGGGGDAAAWLSRVKERPRLKFLLAGSLVLSSTLSLAACVPGRPQAEASARASQRLFARSCAACHGNDARGSGTVAPFLSVAVPDLTRIQARRGGSFPDLEVYQTISGLSAVVEPGSRHMPIWGYEYFGPDADDEAAHRRATRKVQGLVRYLRDLQR